MKCSRTIGMILLVVFFLCCNVNTGISASVPSVLNYQGTLADSSGNPVTGQHEMTFRLYNDLLGGTAFWSETQTVAFDANGHFSVTLGSTTPVNKDNFTGQTFIGIQIGTDPELAPRQQLTSVAYALKAADAIPAGAIMQFAGSSPPNGWLLCKGQEVSRTTYANLYAMIGDTYGNGDGSTTFNLPDVQGKAVFGVSDSDSDFELADIGGSKQHTLTVAEIPVHTHTGPSHSHSGSSLSTNTTGNHTHSYTSFHYNPQPNNSTKDDFGRGWYNSSHQTSSAGNHSHSISGNTGLSGTGATGSAGGGNAHNVMNPFIALNMIIKY